MKKANVFLWIMSVMLILGFSGCSSPVSPSPGGAPVIRYSVYYHANGGTGDAPFTDTQNEGDEVTIKDKGSLAKPGWNFLHWNTQANGLGQSYQIGQKFNISANLNLYAIWTQELVVQYHNNENFAATAVSGVVPEAQSYPDGTVITIADNSGNLARPEYTFTRWNAKADGSGANFTPGDTITLDASTYPSGLHLYAKWEAKPEHSFSYNGNNHSSGSVPAARQYREDAVITVGGNTGNLARTGYLFDGWNTNAAGTGTHYASGSTITMGNLDITLYAKWKELYRITYNANGGTGTVPNPSAYAQQGTKIAISPIGNLKKTDHYFKGWNTEADGTGTFYYPGDEYTINANNIVLYAIWIEGRFFNARTATDDSWYIVGAKKLIDGAHCIIYADETINFSLTDASKIRDEYELRIHQQMVDNFATFEDIDNNQKIIILLLDIKDGYNSQVGGGYVAGYFDATHMFSKSTYLKSNEADMLFIDTNPGWMSGTTEEAEETQKSLYTTIAHELQHLINFSRTFNGKPEMDLWINEGLSSAAEYVYGGYQESRIDFFNLDPLGTIGRGNNFYVWDGIWETVYGDTLANYSTVYLFFQWLRIHANNDTGIYKDIINSTSGDYNAVTQAAASRIHSAFGTWKVLLETWMWANIKVAPTGYDGYKNNDNLKPLWYEINAYYQTPRTSWNLYPGEGVFSIRTPAATFTPVNAANIGYTYELCLPYFIPPEYSQYSFHTYLTMNYNTAINGNYNTGSLATNIQNVVPMNSMMSIRANFKKTLPQRYPVSFSDKVRENEGKNRNTSGIENKK